MWSQPRLSAGTSFRMKFYGVFDVLPALKFFTSHNEFILSRDWKER